MKKLDLSKKAIRYRKARIRYCAKRHTKKWRNRKNNRKLTRQYASIKKIRQSKKKPLSLYAPKNFSLIDNTDEVLAYFDNARETLKKENNIIIDISSVDVLTPPTVALMIANINDKKFFFDSHISGNAPVKPELRKLFTESGFYDHVNTKGSFKRGNDNYLHKEVDKIVDPDVAKEAKNTGTRHVFGNEEPFDAIFDTLVECMQNTNNHANVHKKGECYWWLYVYSDPTRKFTSYSFLDLGVGIFNSIVVKNYINKFKKISPFHGNISLVDDLLSGKIGSRMDKDRNMRGKGIPQIVENSKSKYFSSFVIIVNDVKINLKTGVREKLSHPLNGTFLYWELEKGQ